MPLPIGSIRPDRRVGRDGRVDGVAAALEDLHARARGQRLAGRDDAVAGGHHRAADEGPDLFGGHHREA